MHLFLQQYYLWINFAYQWLEMVVVVNYLGSLSQAIVAPALPLQQMILALNIVYVDTGDFSRI